MTEKMKFTRKMLLDLYKQKNYLSEDEIVDICIDNNLTEVQIAEMCDILFSKGIFITENKSRNDCECNEKCFLGIIRDKYPFQKAQQIIDTYFEICDSIEIIKRKNINIFEHSPDEIKKVIIENYLPTIRSNNKKQLIRILLREYDRFFQLYPQTFIISESNIVSKQNDLQYKCNIDDLGEMEVDFIDIIKKKYLAQRAERIISAFYDIKEYLGGLGYNECFNEKNYIWLTQVVKSKYFQEEIAYEKKQSAREFLREFKKYIVFKNRDTSDNKLFLESSITYNECSINSEDEKSIDKSALKDNEFCDGKCSYHLTGTRCIQNNNENSNMLVDNPASKNSEQMLLSEKNTKQEIVEFILEKYNRWLLEDGFMERVASIYVSVMREYHEYSEKDKRESPLLIFDKKKINDRFNEDCNYISILCKKYGKTKVDTAKKYYIKFIDNNNMV